MENDNNKYDKNLSISIDENQDKDQKTIKYKEENYNISSEINKLKLELNANLNKFDNLYLIYTQFVNLLEKFYNQIYTNNTINLSDYDEYTIIKQLLVECENKISKYIIEKGVKKDLVKIQLVYSSIKNIKHKIETQFEKKMLNTFNKQYDEYKESKKILDETNESITAILKSQENTMIDVENAKNEFKDLQSKYITFVAIFISIVSIMFTNLMQLSKADIKLRDILILNISVLLCINFLFMILYNLLYKKDSCLSVNENIAHITKRKQIFKYIKNEKINIIFIFTLILFIILIVIIFNYVKG